MPYLHGGCHGAVREVLRLQLVDGLVEVGLVRVTCLLVVVEVVGELSEVEHAGPAVWGSCEGVVYRVGMRDPL